jgi:fumarate hydratase subunit alpha
MRDIVKQMLVEANTVLRDDVYAFLRQALAREESPHGKECLEVLVRNADLARANRTPICQDTGLVSVFLELPEGKRLPKGFLELLEEAVAEAYVDNGFRASTVFPPLGNRRNRGTNTPPFVTILPVEATRPARLTVMPKGAGSENASLIVNLRPSLSPEEFVDAIVPEIVARAARSCPPVVVGIGIGGTFDKAPLLAKRALLRRLGEHSRDPNVARLERHMLERINESGIGPCALGGSVTCLWVSIEMAATHIASLPVAVSMSCHALRSATVDVTAWCE